jgi:hypothetical protein
MLGYATALAGVLTYLALRVYCTGQWPPPSVPVLWKTTLRTERQATIAATLTLVLAVMSLAYGVTTVRLVWP